MAFSSFWESQKNRLFVWIKTFRFCVGAEYNDEFAHHCYLHYHHHHHRNMFRFPPAPFITPLKWIVFTCQWHMTKFEKHCYIGTINLVTSHSTVIWSVSVSVTIFKFRHAVSIWYRWNWWAKNVGNVTSVKAFTILSFSFYYFWLIYADLRQIAYVQKVKLENHNKPF